MAKESYIERLQRERGELIDHVIAFKEWRQAADVLNTTGRKGTALQELLKKEKTMEEAYSRIEQYTK